MASASSIKTYARRVRSHSNAEDKLDELSKAIEEIAGVLDALDHRIRNAENWASQAATRR